MLKQYFIKEGIKEVRIEDFIRNKFPSGDYSKIELQRTPLGIKLVIYTDKPGRIIGRGGKNINDMTEALKNEFELDNIQLDVKIIENPDLDAKIVAKKIASALMKGFNYKKIGNLTLRRIMDAGAAGAEIIIAGKLGGSKKMVGKFLQGRLKFCGDTAKEFVDFGFEEANTKPGKIGVKVKIMREFKDISGNIAKVSEINVDEKKDEIQEVEPETKKDSEPEKKDKKEQPKEEKTVKKPKKKSKK